MDIKDSKVPFVLELLRNFPFVKVQPISDEKVLLIGEIEEAVENLRLVKSGLIQGRSAKELLDEI